jgi:hypothetical protein
MAFLNSPCHETPKNAIKKNNSTTYNKGRGKKTEGKKSRIFCDEPRWTFFDFFSVFLNSPCYETPKKRPLKKSIKNKNKNKNKIK